MLFVEYRTLVLRDYQEKVAAGALSSRLAHPSPAQLRDECVAVCDERYDKKDDQILRTFFGPYSNVDACRQLIEQKNINKFKPLANFLKDPTIFPKQKNIDLLAWLIDFQPRPFEKAKTSNLSIPVEQSGNQDDHPQEEVPNEPAVPTVNIPSPPISGKPEPKSGRKVIILAVVMAIVVSLGTYWVSKRKAPSIALTGNEKCMYWTGDHYEPVSCSQKMENTLVVALDSERLNHFKRITETDTITLRSAGVVGCVKVRGTVEFYTTSGTHPTETQLRVRPASEYMITKYAKK